VNNVFPLPFNRNPNPVITEPEHNSYPPYKVLRRVDNLFVVHDTRQTWPMSFGPLFRHEENARKRAAELAAKCAPIEPPLVRETPEIKPF
jgi:hypothetical protein